MVDLGNPWIDDVGCDVEEVSSDSPIALVIAQAWAKPTAMNGLTVTCPSSDCEVRFKHPQNAISPSGSCPSCGAEYLISLQGRIMTRAQFIEIQDDRRET